MMDAPPPDKAMFFSCIDKQAAVVRLFSSCSNDEERYHTIMRLGKTLPSLDPSMKTEGNRVYGCQSQMYLYVSTVKNCLRFQAEADALISQGLAALLIAAYDGETPEVVLRCPPDFLNQVNIPGLVSPSRANGLMSLHLRMKQEALKFLVRQNTTTASGQLR